VIIIVCSLLTDKSFERRRPTFKVSPLYTLMVSKPKVMNGKDIEKIGPLANGFKRTVGPANQKTQPVFTICTIL